MSRIWIRFVATCGVVAGVVFACQLGTAAEPVPGGAAAGGADGSQPPAALPGPGRRSGRGPAATGGVSRAAAQGTVGPPAARGTADARPPDEPLTVLKSGPDHVRVVYRLKNKPAMDTEQVLKQLFRLEGGLPKSAAISAKGSAGSSVAMATDTISNCIVISGPPEAVEEVRTLVEKLDQPAGMLLLEVEIGVAPVGEPKPVEGPNPKEKSPVATAEPFRLPRRPEKMETTGRVRMVTLDNQPALVQMGSRVPRVTGVSTSSTGGQMKSTSLDNVGLIVMVTPRINADGVVMQIDVEQSQLGSENEGIPISAAGDKVVRSPRIDATTLQMTVTIPNAQTMILGSVAQKGKSDKELVVIVTPHILGLEEAKKVR